MSLACFRHLAWVLVSVLLAGLMAPAFASMPSMDGMASAPRTHVHSDGSAHVHGMPSLAQDAARASASDDMMASKPPQHCPGCLSAADCAVSCLGLGLLPAPIPMSAGPAAQAWAVGAVPSPAGAGLASDLDPPRPVTVR